MKIHHFFCFIGIKKSSFFNVLKLVNTNCRFNSRIIFDTNYETHSNTYNPCFIPANDSGY
jgi:hypothetical protein